MTLPSTIELPSSVVGQTPILNHTKEYSINVNLTDEQGITPWEVGMLLSGATNRFIKTSGSNPPTDGEFNIQGNQLKLAAAIILSSTHTSSNVINLGWMAGERTPQNADTLAGSLQVNKTSGSSTFRKPATTVLTLSDPGYPYFVTPLSVVDIIGNYSGTIAVSGTGFEQSVVANILNKDGELVGILTPGDSTIFYYNISPTNPYYVVTSLLVNGNGTNNLDWTIGDPRRDGRVTVTQV